jgi:flagellar hook assembly protein FlgD/outer membrane protein OmpA-like peptidoglycan-associated protein
MEAIYHFTKTRRVRHSFCAVRFVSLSVLCFVFALHAQEPAGFRVSSNLSAFSPDSDGIQDSVLLRPVDVPEECENPADYVVRIESDRPVRTFRADRRLIRPARSPGNLFLPFSDSVRPLEMFEELQWDGRDDLGKTVADGTYSARIICADANGKQIESAPAKIIVSTKKPQLAVNSTARLLLRPFDAEGKPAEKIEGEVKIYQTVQAEAGTIVRAEIRDSSGLVVEMREWNGAVSNSVTWNGRNAKGELAAHGTYSYVLTARTASGVIGRTDLPGILIVPELPTVDLAPDEAFSPNGDGQKDKLQFLVSYFGTSPRGAIKSYRLEIFEAGKPLAIYDSLTPRSLPGVLVWDGQTSAGMRAIDGIYEARLTLDTTAGEMKSARVAFRLDTTPPVITVNLKRSSFSPDGDGEDELMPVEVRGIDESGIESWTLRVLVTPDSQVRVSQLMRLWQGVSLPENLVWNGNTQASDQVESLEILTFSLEARDRAGNTTMPALDRVRTSVLFRPTEPGATTLVSRLPVQKYFARDHSLTSDGKDMVSELRSALGRYRRYYVHLYAVAALPGPEEENLEATEKRARAVFKKMEDSWNKDRIDFQGLGESEVLFLSSDPYSNYRNERMEVRLVP